jgi:hypothetical protein
MNNLLGTKAIAVTPSDTNYITDSLPVIIPAPEQVTKTVTATVLATDLFTIVGHGYLANDVVRFESVGTVTGINTLSRYFVIYVDADTFKVSASFNGSAVDLGGATTTLPTVIETNAMTTVRVAGTLWVGVSGNLNVLLSDHEDTNTATAASNGATLFVGVPIGPFPYQVKKVFATNTTATNIVCAYN